MKILKELRKDLFLVDLTEEEVTEINNYINLEDEEIEIWQGENVLEKDTLWLIYSEVNRIPYKNSILLNLNETLKKHLRKVS